uniref:Uncharacterized protein n=1 Tax=Knipowitschia caucasica TaxID=637954 RepID=A0AAV2LC66_KNICA
MRLKPPYGEKEAAWLCRDICHGGKSISRFAQGLHLRQIDMLQEGITGSSASLTKLAHVLRKVCKAAVQRMRRRGKQIVGRRERLFSLTKANSDIKESTTEVEQVAGIPGYLAYSELKNKEGDQF